MCGKQPPEYVRSQQQSMLAVETNTKHKPEKHREMERETTSEAILTERNFTAEEVGDLVGTIAEIIENACIEAEITDIDGRHATSEGSVCLDNVEVMPGVTADIEATTHAEYRYTAATYYDPEEFTFLRGSASVEEISLWDTEAEEYIMVPSELWDGVRMRIANIKDW